MSDPVHFKRDGFIATVVLKQGAACRGLIFPRDCGTLGLACFTDKPQASS